MVSAAPKPTLATRNSLESYLERRVEILPDFIADTLLLAENLRAHFQAKRRNENSNSDRTERANLMEFARLAKRFTDEWQELENWINRKFTEALSERREISQIAATSLRTIQEGETIVRTLWELNKTSIGLKRHGRRPSKQAVGKEIAKFKGGLIRDLGGAAEGAAAEAIDQLFNLLYRDQARTMLMSIFLDLGEYFNDIEALTHSTEAAKTAIGETMERINRPLTEFQGAESGKSFSRDSMVTLLRQHGEFNHYREKTIALLNRVTQDRASALRRIQRFEIGPAIDRIQTAQKAGMEPSELEELVGMISALRQPVFDRLDFLVNRSGLIHTDHDLYVQHSTELRELFDDLSANRPAKQDGKAGAGAGTEEPVTPEEVGSLDQNISRLVELRRMIEHGIQGSSDGSYTNKDKEKRIRLKSLALSIATAQQVLRFANPNEARAAKNGIFALQVLTDMLDKETRENPDMLQHVHTAELGPHSLRRLQKITESDSFENHYKRLAARYSHVMQPNPGAINWAARLKAQSVASSQVASAEKRAREAAIRAQSLVKAAETAVRTAQAARQLEEKANKDTIRQFKKSATMQRAKQLREEAIKAVQDAVRKRKTVREVAKKANAMEVSKRMEARVAMRDRDRKIKDLRMKQQLAQIMERKAMKAANSVA